jgi:processive 1,2-diacylglycerol beta-glucosyltransferase
MSPSPRILILSASAGAGHVRAAQAVELALRELAPEAEVENVDVLTLANAAFRKLYGEAYLDLVNKAPHVLGYFYDVLDRPPSARRKSDRLRYLVQKFNLRPLIAKLTEKPWDLFVNTHFLPAEMIAHLKKKKRVTAPQLTVTTDFETHRLWVNQPCDHYFTATDEGAEYLIHWGVPRSDVTVSGIPIHPVFRSRMARAELLAKHGVEGRAPIVLQLAGGFGVGPVEETFRAILSLESPVELVVVAGRNEAAQAKLARIEVPERHRARVLGFTTEIDEWMGLASVVVSKPGGLTTSELLARGAAIAIVHPIPGQESRNSDWLLENGVAIKINHVATLPRKLGDLLADRGRLAAMRARAFVLGRPDAAFTVASAALGFAGGAAKPETPQ